MRPRKALTVPWAMRCVPGCQPLLEPGEVAPEPLERHRARGVARAPPPARGGGHSRARRGERSSPVKVAAVRRGRGREAAGGGCGPRGGAEGNRGRRPGSESPLSASRSASLGPTPRIVRSGVVERLDHARGRRRVAAAPSIGSPPPGRERFLAGAVRPARAGRAPRRRRRSPPRRRRPPWGSSAGGRRPRVPARPSPVAGRKRPIGPGHADDLAPPRRPGGRAAGAPCSPRRFGPWRGSRRRGRRRAARRGAAAVRRGPRACRRTFVEVAAHPCGQDQDR